MKRPLLGALVVAAISLVGCSTIDPNAATVDGSNIKMRDFQRDLSLAVKESPDAVDSGTVQANFAAQLLGVQVIGTALEREASKLGLTPSSAGEQRAAELAPQFLGMAVADQFPKAPAQRRQVATSWARAYVALIEKHTLPEFDKAGLRSLYAEMVGAKQITDMFCGSHILVETEAQAAAARSRIISGEAFEEVAKDVSIDTGSGVSGGKLIGEDGGCIPADGLVAEFVAGARSATPGVPSEPVKSEFGYHLIKLDKALGVPSFDEAQATVEAASQERRTAPARQYFDTLISEARVAIDPRFGTWNPATGDITPAAGAAPSP